MFKTVCEWADKHGYSNIAVQLANFFEKYADHHFSSDDEVWKLADLWGESRAFADAAVGFHRWLREVTGW